MESELSSLLIGKGVLVDAWMMSPRAREKKKIKKKEQSSRHNRAGGESDVGGMERPLQSHGARQQSAQRVAVVAGVEE